MPKDPSELTTRQRVSYYLSNLALRGLIGTVGLIPYRQRIPAMGKIISALGPLLGADKRVRSNLKMTCPDLSEQEVARLCREVSDNAGRVIAELYAGAPFIDRAKAAPITGAGLAALERARAEGRPAATVVREIVDELASRSADGLPLVVYNAPYDLTLLKHEAKRHHAGPFVPPALDSSIAVAQFIGVALTKPRCAGG